MKRSRFPRELIIGILKEHEAGFGCRSLPLLAEAMLDNAMLKDVASKKR